VTRVSPHPSIVRFPRRVKLGKRDASAYPSKAEQLTPPANFAEVPLAVIWCPAMAPWGGTGGGTQGCFDS